MTKNAGATAPRINTLRIKNLRSIGAEHVTVSFPDQGMLVLLGENNAGKSNITKAIDVLFGDLWPGNRQLEDHDFHGRDSDGIAVEIGAQVTGLPCSYCGGDVTYLSWKCDPQGTANDEAPIAYRSNCNRCAKTFPDRTMRAALAATMIDADRRLDYQLSYASKYTMLSKLMHRFHGRLLADPARKERLRNGFKLLVREFEGVPEFAEFQQTLAETTADFGQNLPYRLDVDFSAYDPSNFFRSLRVQPSFSGDVRNFDELGTGQSQVLALAFVYAYAKAYGGSQGTILVIDEPEANLHPLAQQWLAERLNDLVAPGLQIILTTHSPHFVDLARPENLVIVRKADSEATRTVQRSRGELRDYVVERGADPERAQPGTIGAFYAANATTEIVSGLFARRCVLVEGRTEALALPALLRLRDLDVLRDGIAVVPVDGIGNIAKWHRLYTALDIPCYCIFDTDADKTGSKADELLAKRRDIMAALKLDAANAEASNLSPAPLAVHERFATLSPNFERATAALFKERWSDLLDAAGPIVGDSKPLRARYAAERLEPSDLACDARSALDSLVKAIRGEPSEAAGGV